MGKGMGKGCGKGMGWMRLETGTTCPRYSETGAESCRRSLPYGRMCCLSKPWRVNLGALSGASTSTGGCSSHSLVYLPLSNSTTLNNTGVVVVVAIVAVPIPSSLSTGHVATMDHSDRSVDSHPPQLASSLSPSAVQGSPSPQSSRRRRFAHDDSLLMQRSASHQSTAASSESIMAAPSPARSAPVEELMPGPARLPTGATTATLSRLRIKQDAARARNSRSNTEMTKAYESFGNLSIFFGTPDSKQKCRAILQQQPRPAPYNDDDDDDGESESGHSSGEDESNVGNRADLDDAEGPNERGTYSKEYTLKHPETKWVHRGQGRYLPASKVKAEPPAQQALRPTRYASSETCLLHQARGGPVVSYH